MSEEKKQTITVMTFKNMPADAARVFDLWGHKRGFRTRRQTMLYIMRAMAAGTLFNIEPPVYSIIVGAKKREMMLEARRAARQEARVVLWEEGFIPDPGEQILGPIELDDVGT